MLIQGTVTCPRGSLWTKTVRRHLGAVVNTDPEGAVVAPDPEKRRHLGAVVTTDPEKSLASRKAFFSFLGFMGRNGRGGGGSQDEESELSTEC
jgi:hypothetical protein